MRCQRLSQNGKRCKKEAKFIITFHVPQEHYPEKTTWGIVYVCKEHIDNSTKYKISNKDFPVDDKQELKKEKSK